MCNAKYCRHARITLAVFDVGKVGAIHSCAFGERFLGYASTVDPGSLAHCADTIAHLLPPAGEIILAGQVGDTGVPGQVAGHGV